MSDTLTDSAPGAGEDSPPVGNEGSPAPTSVEGGSGSGEEQGVSAERFNGLMSSFHKAQAQVNAEKVAREAAEAENARLRSQLEASNTNPTNQEDTPVSDNNQSGQIAQLTEAVANLTRLVGESVVAPKQREELLGSYTDEEREALSAFEDLMVADTPEDQKAVADEILGRLRTMGALGEPASSEGQEPPPEGEEPPVSGPSGDVGAPDLDENLQKAAERGDMQAALAVRLQQANRGEFVVPEDD